MSEPYDPIELELEQRLRRESERVWRPGRHRPPTDQWLADHRRRTRRRNAGAAVASLLILALTVVSLVRAPSAGPSLPTAHRAGQSISHGRPASVPQPQFSAADGSAPANASEADKSSAVVDRSFEIRREVIEQWQAAGPPANGGPLYLVPVTARRFSRHAPQRPSTEEASAPSRLLHREELSAYHWQAIREVLGLEGETGLTEPL